MGTRSRGRATRTQRAQDIRPCVVGKTTGGRGVHVVVPLTPKQTVSGCLEFSRAVSESIVQADPLTYTTRFAKAGRERKILIDYLRNNRTNTSVCAFSPRARAAATVSMRCTRARPRRGLVPRLGAMAPKGSTLMVW